MRARVVKGAWLEDRASQPANERTNDQAGRCGLNDWLQRQLRVCLLGTYMHTARPRTRTLYSQHVYTA